MVHQSTVLIIPTSVVGVRTQRVGPRDTLGLGLKTIILILLVDYSLTN